MCVGPRHKPHERRHYDGRMSELICGMRLNEGRYIGRRALPGQKAHIEVAMEPQLPRIRGKGRLSAMKSMLQMC